MPIISVADLLERWVVRIGDRCFVGGGGKFELHRGTNIGDRGGKLEPSGKRRMQVSFYGGVVLFTGNPQYRTEGARAYFRVIARNYDETATIVHV